MKNLLRAGALVSLLFGSGSSYALTTLTVSQLRAICLDGDAMQVQDAEVADACGLYLRGFLDGAIATDERVVENVVQELDNTSLTQRAYRTRLGPRLKHYGPAAYAGLCISESVTLLELREAVTAALDKEPIPAESAAEFVYQQLLTGFPCNTESQN